MTSGWHQGCRGAQPARREKGEYRQYATDEQRRGPGCIGDRLPAKVRKPALVTGSAAVRATRVVIVGRTTRNLPNPGRAINNHKRSLIGSV